MSIRDILVHLKSHEEWSPHIDYAIRTAKLFSCHVRALVTFHEVVILRNLPRYAGHGSRGADGEGRRHRAAS